MTCTTCQRVVQVNNTGICLGCQRGFVNLPQEDSLKAKTSTDSLIERLEAKAKELEQAIHETD